MASKFGSKAKGTEVSASTESTGSKEPKNVSLFDLRKVDVTDKKSGKVSTKLKIQFAKDVKITYKGTEIDLGEYNSMFLKDNEDMENDLAFLVENEYMSEEQANDRADFIQEKRITHEAKSKNPKIS